MMLKTANKWTVSADAFTTVVEKAEEVSRDFGLEKASSLKKLKVEFLDLKCCKGGGKDGIER